MEGQITKVKGHNLFKWSLGRDDATSKMLDWTIPDASINQHPLFISEGQAPIIEEALQRLNGVKMPTEPFKITEIPGESFDKFLARAFQGAREHISYAANYAQARDLGVDTIGRLYYLLENPQGTHRETYLNILRQFAGVVASKSDLVNPRLHEPEKDISVVVFDGYFVRVMAGHRHSF